MSDVPQTGEPGWVCLSCGSVMSPAEETCHGCGRRLGADQSAPAQAPAEQCRIQRWDGYVVSTFYALTPKGTVVAESGEFRRRGADATYRRELEQRAHQELVAALRARGWTQSAQGSTWFDAYFSRPVPLAAAQQSTQPVRAITEPAPSPELTSSTGDSPLPSAGAAPVSPPDVAPTPEGTAGTPDTPAKTARPDEPEPADDASVQPTERIRDDSTSPMPLVARDAEPEERPAAAQPVPLRPPRRDAKPAPRPPAGKEREFVVPASDPFTRLWRNAGESHGHHLEAVARLREQKQQQAGAEPAAGAEPGANEQGA